MQTISMTFAEWQEKQARIDELERKLNESERAREADRLRPGSDAEGLSKALSHALPIVQFAIASYEPRMYPGWPHDDLHELARLLADLPGVPAGLRETVPDLILFANHAKEWENARADGKHLAKFYEENAGYAIDPPPGFFDGPKIEKP